MGLKFYNFFRSANPFYIKTWFEWDYVFFMMEMQEKKTEINSPFYFI